MDGNKKGKFGIALLVIGALAGLAYFLVKITNHRKIVFSSTPVMDEYDFSDCDGCEDGDCAACSGITFDDADAEDQN